MIHVLDFEGKIIDYIDQDDLAVYKVLHKRSTETETLDIEIDNERAEHFKRRHRVIIKDKTDKYREFIIDRATEESGAVIVEATASHLVDLKNAKPLQKGSFKNMGVNQKVSEVLRDSGWEVNNSVFAGITNTTWDKTIYANDLLIQIAEEHKVKYEFEVVIDGYEVTKRYVNIEEPVHLFQGREIVYGKDLESMKRSIDFSEVRTALYIVGPEEEKKPSKVTTVVDDKAQEQFGDSYHYIWDIFEPSDNVTADTSVDELKRLGKQELAKRNSAALSYEINIIDLEQEFPHEVINFGDIVRIKNPDFVPSLYAESEVIGIEYELISGECNYTFGNIVERKEDELLKYFRDRIFYINQKLNDGLTNVNTIVKDAVDNELQYFEKKIFKGTEPPENPVNDILWLDTSNPNVSVLRRYWNGEWINSTAENANDVGAVTREQALYSELTNTFVNLSIQHSKLLNEMHDVINSEYLVDFDLKDELNAKLDATVSIYNNIKSNLESMTDETATIGKLIDTQTLFLNYRTAMQNLYNVVERAKVAIDERFKLLQSQYTEEKFREALQEIADKFGLQVNSENQLLGEPNVVEKAVIVAREDTKEQLRDYVKSVDYQTNQQGLIERMETADAERKTLAGQISDKVTKSEYQSGLDNIKIGGVNLFEAYDSATHGNSVHSSITSTQSFRGKYWATTLYTADYLKKVLVPGEEYTYSYELEIVGLSDYDIQYAAQHGIILYSQSVPKDSITTSYKSIERILNNKFKVTQTFVAPEIVDHRFMAYSGLYTPDGRLGTQRDSNLVEIRNLKLEKGNKATDYTEAPSDVARSTDKKLTVAKTEILQDGEQISQRVSLEVFNASSQTLNRVVSEFVNNTSDGMTFRYDENGNIQSHSIGPEGVKIKGDKVDIQLNREFNLLVGNVKNKADETNIINKINLSREGLDINVNRIGIRGGDSVNYVDIRNDQIELSGEYTRTFRGNTQRDNVYTKLKDGLLRFRNNTQNRSLYYSDFGISTFIDGNADSSSGTLQFFDNTYSSNARGVTLNSVHGIVALRSDNNSVVIESNLTANIESNNYSVYIRPFKKSRAGLNEFQFYVKDADSSGETDGCLLYGNLTDPNGMHGSGIRFSKSQSNNILYVTNPNGDIGTGDISVRMAEIREHIRTIGMLEVRQWSDARAYNQIKVGAVNTTNSVVMASHSRSHAYYGVGGGTNELRVTDNNGYNGGNTRYKSVRADTFYGKTGSNSSEKYKTNIKEWEVDATQLLKDTVFYEYNYKSDLLNGDKQKSHGIIIEREMPRFITRDNDSIDLYEFISTIGKALQEQIKRNDELEFKYENIMRILEEYSNEQTR